MPNYIRYLIPNSIVFVTIVTYNRQPILIDNIDILRNSFAESCYKFTIIAAVVLNDHLHILIKPNDINDLPKIIFSIKYRFTKNLGGVGTPPYKEKRKGEKCVWQSRYYDHIIRSETDLHRHIDYIHYNSMKHLNIAPKDYQYSSFDKFVKNGYYDIDWCNFGDKYKISELDYE